MLTVEEIEKYSRQISLKEIGREGQVKLKKSKVAVIGAGGLGSPCVTYLAVAGIGKLLVIDKDVVELSNLNRQILHWHRDINKPKVFSFREKIKELNPYIEVECEYNEFSETNAYSLLDGCDFVVDALDNYRDRVILNKVCFDLNIPYVHGGVYGFEGEVMTVLPGKSACICCRRGGLESVDSSFPVVGFVPGVIGTIQASEVIKGLLGVGELLLNKVLRYNSLTQEFLCFNINKNSECEFCSKKLWGDI